jgi:competence CoiA-like predicted nuclease
MNNSNNDSIASMCSGLITRKAKSLKTNKLVLADQVTKEDGPFYCPECYSDAIVRKCIEKDDHFAHKANLSSLFSSGETQLHKDCKNEIVESLKKQYPNGNWEVERTIKANKSKNHNEVIPDISGRINNIPIVIEVQRSFLSLEKIKKRSEEYRKRNIAILWIVPIKQDLPTDNFRPRLFEKFLHDMYFGKVYYWLKGNGSKVIPIHYDTGERYIPVTTFYDIEIQEEVSFGGYTKKYKTIKTPNYLGKLLDIGKDFYLKNAPRFQSENKEYDIPERIIYRDKNRKWW